MTLKKCTKCNVEKEISLFYLRKKDGYIYPECKSCKFIRDRKIKEHTKIDNLPNEFWVDVIGFENLYQISNLNRVKTLQRIENLSDGKEHIVSSEKIMLTRKNRYGYVRIIFFKKGIGKKEFTMHRLMAIHFIPNPENKPEVNHINGIKSDNRIENLEWVTKKENAIHARKTGLRDNTFGEKNHNAKLNEFEVKLIKRIYRRYGKFNMAKLSRKLNVSETTVAYVIKNKIWNHISI